MLQGYVECSVCYQILHIRYEFSGVVNQSLVQGTSAFGNAQSNSNGPVQVGAFVGEKLLVDRHVSEEWLRV